VKFCRTRASVFCENSCALGAAWAWRQRECRCFRKNARRTTVRPEYLPKQQPINASASADLENRDRRTGRTFFKEEISDRPRGPGARDASGGRVDWVSAAIADGGPRLRALARVAASQCLDASEIPPYVVRPRIGGRNHRRRRDPQLHSSVKSRTIYPPLCGSPSRGGGVTSRDVVCALPRVDGTPYSAARWHARAKSARAPFAHLQSRASPADEMTGRGD